MPQNGKEILERGDIFFFYRPRVDEDEPSGLSDVQRFFMALRPEQGGMARLMVVGRKRLPDVRRHERFWGFVAKVTDRPAEIAEGLRGDTYQTKTRGKQHEPPARPAGEGRYAVVLINGEMHLVYELELPEQPGEVQRALRIAPKASFVLSIKNPEKGSPPGAGLGEEQDAEYPDRLQREFHGRRFASEDVRLLDVEGAQFILVGARTDPEKSYGVDLETEQEDERHAEIFRDLQLSGSRHPVKPLFEGKWE